MFKFKLSVKLTSADITALKPRVPGVKCWKDTVSVGINCAWLLESVLRELNVGYQLISKPEIVSEAPPDFAKIPNLQPWASEFLRSFQREPIERNAKRIWAPAGSGKTLVGIVWGCMAEGPCIFVTGAKARLQIGREIERFTTTRPWILMETLPDVVPCDVPVPGSTEVLSRIRGHVAVRSVAALYRAGAEAIHSDDCPVAHGASVDCVPGAECFVVEQIEGVGKKTGALRARAIWISRIEDCGRRSYMLKAAGETVAAEPPKFIVVGYEGTVIFRDMLLALKPKSIIFDEIHKAKSHKRFEAISVKDDEAQNRAEVASGHVAVRFQKKDNYAAACADLSRAVSRRLGMSASPVKDRVRDLWAQLDLTEPGEWGGFYDWAKRYTDAHEGAFGGIDTRGCSNVEELEKRISFGTYQVPYAVTHASLPPKRRQVIYLDPSQQVSPLDMRDEFERIKKELPSRNLVELRLAEAASRKRRALAEYVTEDVEGGSKVVVFTGRRLDCQWIFDAVKKALGKRSEIPVWWFHGGFSMKERDQIVTDYMATKTAGLLIATIDSAGESLNLHDTDVAYIAQLPDTPGALIQGEGRFSRLGQLRPVLLRYLIAVGTIDEEVASRLINKLPVAEGAHSGLTGLSEDLRGVPDEQELIDGLLAKIIGKKAEA